MNKLLVTGLALGKEADVCDVCNFDLNWLLRYPSVLIWADKILVTEFIWHTVQGEYWPEEKEMARCCKLIFEMAKDNGIIEIINPSKIINPDLKDIIREQVERDINLLKKYFPEKITTRRMGDSERSPTETIIDGVSYCPVYIWTIYAGLILARAFEANCLFNPRVLYYCRYKFGISGIPLEGDIGKIESFTKVFDAFIPNEPIIPYYAHFSHDACLSCENEKKCKDTYLMTLEETLTEFLKWRSYEEIEQIKSVIQRIITKRRENSEVIDPEEIINEFRNEEKRLQKRVRSVFPKVKRWANIATMFSIPMAVSGVASGVSLLTVAGAGTAGISQLAKEIIQLLESKYRWLSFLPSIPASCQDKKE